jgi:glucose-1-phosphate thymidylyltransferase
MLFGTLQRVKAFILAGGFATRLWPLTEKRAKPLLPLAGKPLLDHLIHDLPADISITVSTNEAFGEGFRAWAETHDRPIEVLIEKTQNDDQKLGALGAVAQWIAQAAIEDDVLLLAGDNYIGFSMQKFLETYKPGRALVAAYDIGSLEKAGAFGTVIRGADGSVSAFEEKPKDPKTTLVSTGVSVLPKDTLPHVIAHAAVKPDNVGGIFEEFLRLHIPVDCFTFNEAWFDIGSFDAYLEATRALVGDRLLAEDAAFEDSQREGSVVLGKGTKVIQSRLRDTVVFEGCVIEDCVLEDCVIDAGCILKGADLTGKMIRAGTTLMRN